LIVNLVTDRKFLVMQSHHMSLKKHDPAIAVVPDMLRMGLMERWGFRMGIISRETLQKDINTKL
ncbi:MAG: hypothetical protein EBT93_15480, partial [Alphaproteobacteria bacterium]|nr:hypothetical protein [Alphaproteobacteria bacterium]